MAFPTAMPWIPAIALLVLLTAAQELFLETHRRRYGMWRSTRQRRFFATQDERRVMARAMIHRDPDVRVELTRLVFIAVAVLVFVGLFGLLGSTAVAPRR
jgi:hypothetical protein